MSGRIFLILITLIVTLNCKCIASLKNEEDCTEIAKDEETLLVFSTLGGGLTAIDPITSETRWSIDDEPAIRVPGNDNNQYSQHYLPDPRDGSLYQMNGVEGGLKKLPYTIPQLVASAPCRSSDGILYSGKKSDSWFIIDPKTGRREKVVGFGSPINHNAESIGWATSRSVFLGRTQYTVMMYDSLSNSKPWNVTFYDYSSHTMAPELSDAYEWLHVTSTETGSAATLNRRTGSFMWLKDLKSPVVAAFLLSPEGLLSVPFTTVSDKALSNILEYSKYGTNKDLKLFETLYVGEHSNNIYAIPSLVDDNTGMIPSDPPVKFLLDGPSLKNPDGSVNVNDLIMKNTDNQNHNNQNYIVFGHYQIPKSDENIKLKLSSSVVNPAPSVNHQLARVIGQDQHTILLPPRDNIISSKSVGIQTETDIVGNSANTEDETNATIIDMDNDKLMKLEILIKTVLKSSREWFGKQENSILKLALIILLGTIIAMLWYLYHTVRELKQQSQNGSKTGSNRSGGGDYHELEELVDGEIKVGKIIFNPVHILGKGCDGTFVFRGKFEKRNVAVKRLLPECFTLADREVTLLRESDAHENVVRYFCTEQDRQFRYIAVELCAATLQDFTEGELSNSLRSQIQVIEVLRQATNGLQHLHSLNIVHRDIKPQNVLLSQPDNNKVVRAMISDFGLCKKLNIGKASFSRRSGITGTEGWIAPEMIRGQRTTTSVDIFSLGCVFYYVLTKGSHPFGDNLKRQGNILSSEFDLKLLQKEDATNIEILAAQLIQDMINRDPHRRPSANAIKNHALFWKEDKILAFLQDVSDRVEKADLLTDPLRTLERNAKFVCRDDWNNHLDSEITADLRKYRGYQGISVRDLLRALRNKKHHYHELSYEAQNALGPIPHEFTKYWISRFPNLLSHSYHSLQLCSQEILFKSYYDAEYEFTKPDYLNQYANDNIELMQNYEMIKNLSNKNSPQKGGYNRGNMNRNNKDNANGTNSNANKSTKRGHYNFVRVSANSDSSYMTRNSNNSNDVRQRVQNISKDDRKSAWNMPDPEN